MLARPRARFSELRTLSKTFVAICSTGKCPWNRSKCTRTRGTRHVMPGTLGSRSKCTLLYIIFYFTFTLLLLLPLLHFQVNSWRMFFYLIKFMYHNSFVSREAVSSVWRERLFLACGATCLGFVLLWPRSASSACQTDKLRKLHLHRWQRQHFDQIVYPVCPLFFAREITYSFGHSFPRFFLLLVSGPMASAVQLLNFTIEENARWTGIWKKKKKKEHTLILYCGKRGKYAGESGRKLLLWRWIVRCLLYT